VVRSGALSTALAARVWGTGERSGAAHVGASNAVRRSTWSRWPAGGEPQSGSSRPKVYEDLCACFGRGSCRRRELLCSRAGTRLAV